MTRTEFTTRFDAMTRARAAHILTMVEEPELLLEPGQQPPTFTAEEIRMARCVSEWEVQALTGGH